MTREEEIRNRYEKELKNMRREQSTCNHDWDEIKIDRKDAEIRRLKKLVSELNENIKIVGRQNTKLKKKCDRYERRLTEMHFNIEADCQ